jgi:flagellar hook-associated protein 2
VAISTPGIGSGLDVDSIISKLMQVEAAPLANFDKKAAAVQTKISAYGALSGSLASFQGALSVLSAESAFQSVSAQSSNTEVINGTATAKTVAGSYKLNVSQVAQAQTLVSTGLASSSATIGVGTSTRITFKLGSVSGGSFGVVAGALGAGVATGGIANGSLSLNGVAITTSSSTRTAKLLADAINDKSVSSGVSASAVTSTSATLFGAAGVTSFGAVDTSASGTYSLSVGGVALAAQADGIGAGAGVTAASIDATLAGSNATTTALAAAGITFTGTAADGTLRFFNDAGADIAIEEAVTGTVSGGIGTDSASANAGSSVTANATLTLTSASGSPITIAGANPALAGLTAGQAGSYLDAAFTQQGTESSGSVVIDSTNNTLQGIRDAINKGNFGVTASIISDGSATPNHLVLTSTKTGAKSTMQISLAGSGGGPADPALEALLSYDPGGAQALQQTSAAQDTLLTANGVAVQSSNNTVTGAIEGVTLTISKAGAANLVVSKDSSAVKGHVSTFVKSYNELLKSIKELSGYNSEAKKGGPLLGDSTIQSLQASLRKQLGTSIKGLTGSFSSLSQVGISFQKDGTLSTDNTKLEKAIKDNLADISGLFAAIGKTSDSLVSYTSAGAKTQAGEYALNVTQLATQGSLTSTGVIGGATVIADNTSWVVRLNDTDPPESSNSVTVTIPAGTYTASELATTIQSAINGNSTFSGSGKSVSASIDGNGNLLLASSTFGSLSNVSLSSVSGTSVDDVFGVGAAAVEGLDVAGTLGGFAVTGSGKFMTGAAGSPTEGLKIEITGGALGDRGTVNFSQGYAHQLKSLADNFLGASGFIKGKTDGLSSTVKDLTKQKEDFASKLEAIEKRYRAQYTALDTAIASLNSTSNFLTQQFAAMAKSTS